MTVSHPTDQHECHMIHYVMIESTQNRDLMNTPKVQLDLPRSINMICCQDR